MRADQNLVMRLDHVSFAAGPDGLASTAQRIGGLLGTDFIDGGVHPRFGTRNMTLPLAGDIYMEIVEVLDHPASDKAPFGQAVRARSALGGGWLGWVVSVDDISQIEQRLGREAAKGNRHRPDGTELLWQQIGVNGLISDPQLPFFIQWTVPAELHPSYGATGDFSLACLEIAGDPQRVSEWLGETVEAPLEDVKVEWVAPNGTPGIVAVAAPDPRRARPDLSLLEPADRCRRAAAGRAPTSGNTADLRAREPRRRPPRPHRRPRCATRCASTGPGARSSTSAAAPASTCPLAPASAAPVVGVEPHPPPRRARASSYALAGQRHASSRAPPRRSPLPDASVDVAHARWAYFFGPGCEPGLRELDRVVRRGGTAFVIDNDPTRSTFGGWFRRGYPEVDPEAVERFWSMHGWTAHGRSTWGGPSPRAPTSRPSSASSSPPRSAEEVLAAHTGTEVDYAVNLWWRHF